MHAWPIFNSRRGLSVRNDSSLYQQLIRPMMNYACLMWRSAANSHVRMLQVLQSKCLHTASNSPWFVGNIQIHDDMKIQFLYYCVREETETLDSNAADAG
jgi:predicted metal-dependent hydrolase